MKWLLQAGVAADLFLTGSQVNFAGVPLLRVDGQRFEFEKHHSAFGPEYTTSGHWALQHVNASSWHSKGAAQWQLWDLDTFDGDTPWSNRQISFCGSSADAFLGGHCHYGATTTTRHYNLPPHSDVRITARVHFLDEWIGGAVTLKVNGNIVWTKTYHWCPGFLKQRCHTNGINVCGKSHPDRLSARVDVRVPHHGQLVLSFEGNTKVAACDASWGVDDVSVFYKSVLEP
eukprot:GEMP01079733.1.p1 GENE.GEMP01079733.1~~GEMP01079733.1.p1  ORF type:complete len:230 (+),score=61.05 GEMP01079733.1:119-808(+)